MKNVTYQEPAASVVMRCGGINATAELVERDRSVVNKWLLPRERGGTGGVIPAHHALKLLRERSDLTLADFDAPKEAAEA